jgi:TP901 family phage tail tape measure protein
VAISTRELLLILRARDEASKILRGAAGSIGSVSAAAQQAAQRQIQQGAAMTTVGVGVAYAGLQAIQFLNDATNAAMEYNRQAALTLTQTDGLGASIEQIKTIGKDVASSIPVDFKKIQDSLYDIFSSMNVNMPESKKLLTEFSKAAVAGQVDLQDASRATIGILNAYGMKASDVNRVNDIMFQLVRKGVGTYGEFATTIGRAVPSAVRAGQSVETLAGMLAFLTRNGLSAAMASASAGRALDAISNSKTIDHLASLGKTIRSALGDEAAIKIFGKNIDDMSIKVKDSAGNIRPMTAIMTDMGHAIGNLPTADRAAVLQQIFKSSGGTIQARRFFDIAIKQFGQFNDLTNQMINSKGAMEDAYKVMYDTPAMKIQLLSNKWEILKTVIGDIVMPIKGAFAGALADLIQKFTDLDPNIQKNIVQFFGLVAVVMVVVGVVVALAGVFLMLSGAAALAGTTVGAFMAPILLLVVAIIAIAAAIYLAWKNHDMLWAKAKEVWNSIAPYVMPVVDAIKNFGHTIANIVMPILKDLWNTIKSAVQPTLKDLKGAWDELVAALKSAWNSLQPFMPYFKMLGIVVGVVLVGAIVLAFGIIVAVISVAVRVVVAVIQALAQIIKGIVEVVGGVISLIAALLTGNWSAAWEAAKQIVRGFVDIVEGLFKGLWNVLVGIVKGLWDGVVAIFKAAYNILVGHSIVPDLVNAIVSWLASLPGKAWNAISGFASMLYNWASNALGRARDAVVTGANNLVSFAISIPGRILGALGNLGSLLFNAGASILQGLINGIGSMVQTVYNKVSSVASTVRSLWPFSPAKAGPLRQYPMDKAGQNLMKMLSQGIESKRDLILGSMKKISMDVSTAMPSNPVVPDWRGGPSGAGSDGLTQNFHITTQEIDPVKHAADLGWEISRRRG